MKLNTIQISIIKDITEHYIENGDFSENEVRELKKLASMCNQTTRTTGLKLELYHRVPLAMDSIINLLVGEILKLEDAEDDASVGWMNSFYDYIHVKYDFIAENHQSYLLKATTEEALSYCINWVNTQITHPDEWENPNVNS